MTSLEILIRILSDADAMEGCPVYPVVAPQGAALPHCVVNLVSESEGETLGGADGFFESRLSVACHAATATAADASGEVVKLLLRDFNDEVSDGNSPATVLRVVVRKDGADISDHSDDRTLFRRLTDYRMSVKW